MSGAVSNLGGDIVEPRNHVIDMRHVTYEAISVGVR